MNLSQLGPYRLVRKLGKGGMGTVYEGLEVTTSEPAAIKVLSPALAQEEGFRERFESEIESLKLLRHPHIVRLFGWGEDQGHLFYAMELVPGASLEEELRNGRRFTWREATEIGIQTAKALKHAHDHGVIHRDIKPANLLLTAVGEIKLSDFGIAKLFGNAGLTIDGGVLGTAEYMSPEQAEGRPVTSRCDLYSLGGVLYALLAGRPPFKAKNLPEMLQLQRFAQPEPLRRQVPEVPQELEAIILQLLEKDPEARLPNAILLGRRLEAMLRGLSLLEQTAQRQQATGPPADRASAAADDTGYTVSPAGSTPSEAPSETAATLARPSGDWSEAITAADPQVQGPSDGATPETLTPTLAASQIAAGAVSGTARSEQTMGFSLAPSVSRGTVGPASDQTTAPPRSTAGATAGASKFTTLAESDEAEAEEETSRWLFAIQVGLLGLLLLGVVAVGWYFSRPATADALFAQVDKAQSRESTEALVDVEPAVREFLSRFPNDPRRPQVAQALEELADYRRVRRLRRQVVRLAEKPNLNPVERAFLEAESLAAGHPERAIAAFDSLVVLYAANAETSEHASQLVTMARQRLEELRKQLAESSQAHRAELDAQLARAGRLATSDPAAAQAIWRAIVTLYADHPWAAEAVAQAQAALAAATATAEHR